jgi:hypothetical protein
MPRTCGPHEFVYVHTDIPEGMTIREWRARRAAERLVMHEAARRERQRQRVRRRRRWLEDLRVLTRRPRVDSREAHG